MFALGSSASADPIASIYAGAGRSTSAESSGVTGSMIAGGSVRFPRGTGPWSTIVSFDARRISAEDDVQVGDHTRINDARGFGLRGLAGLRVQSRGVARVFAQLSIGVERDSATYEQSMRLGPALPEVTQEHPSSWGVVLEPAFGFSLHSGPVAFGVRLSVSWSGIEPLMPVPIHTEPRKVPDVFLTLFTDLAL